MMKILTLIILLKGTCLWAESEAVKSELKVISTRYEMAYERGAKGIFQLLSQKTTPDRTRIRYLASLLRPIEELQMLQLKDVLLNVDSLSFALGGQKVEFHYGLEKVLINGEFINTKSYQNLVAQIPSFLRKLTDQEKRKQGPIIAAVMADLMLAFAIGFAPKGSVDLGACLERMRRESEALDQDIKHCQDTQTNLKKRRTVTFDGVIQLGMSQEKWMNSLLAKNIQIGPQGGWDHKQCQEADYWSYFSQLSKDQSFFPYWVISKEDDKGFHPVLPKNIRQKHLRLLIKQLGLSPDFLSSFQLAGQTCVLGEVQAQHCQKLDKLFKCAENLSSHYGRSKTRFKPSRKKP